MHCAGKICKILPVDPLIMLIDGHVLVLSCPDVLMINSIWVLFDGAVSLGEHVHSRSSSVADSGIWSVLCGIVPRRRHVDSESSRMVVCRALVIDKYWCHRVKLAVGRRAASNSQDILRADPISVDRLCVAVLTVVMPT